MNRATRACAALGASGACHLLMGALALVVLRTRPVRLASVPTDEPVRLELVPVVFSEAPIEDETAPALTSTAAPSPAVPPPASAAWASEPLTVPAGSAVLPQRAAPADRPAPFAPAEADPGETSPHEERAAGAAPAAAAKAAPAQAHVEAPPAPGRAIRPRYPAGARRRGEEGVVTLRLAIDARGAVVGVEVLTPGAFPDLVAAATAAARRATFKPARRDGVPVPSTVELPFAFRLRD